MTRLRGRRPSPALVVAIIALVLSMGGVSYGLATGSVDSRAIKDNTIRTQDIRNGHVRQFDINKGAVRARHIFDGAVGSSEVADNSLRGNDIQESTLGKVPASYTADDASTVGGLSPSQLAIGRSARADCATSGTRFNCARATVPLQQPGRLLVVAQVPGDEPSSCWIELDGVRLANTALVSSGYALTTVTGPLSEANHAVNIACEESHTGTTISAVALGAS